MTDVATPVEKVPQAPRPERLLSQNFGLAEFKSREWYYELSESQQPADLLRPEFWADKADQIRGNDGKSGRGNRIYCWKPDTGWAAFAKIDEIGKGYVKISFFSEAAAEAVSIPDSSPLTTKWIVGNRTFSVIRKLSGEVLQSGFQTKEGAARWIADHTKAMAA